MRREEQQPLRTETPTSERKGFIAEAADVVRRGARSAGVRATALGVTGAVVVGALAGCGDKDASATPSGDGTHSTPAASETLTPSETAPAQTEVEKKFAEAKAQYEAFLKNLNAAQQTKATELSPDSLAGMADEQVVDAARIPLAEVSDASGNLDPLALARSETLRIGAIETAGCSEATFQQYGGVLQMTADNIKTVNEKYTRSIARGGANNEGTPDPAVLNRCTSIEGIRSLGDDAAKAVQPYEYITYLQENTVQYDAATGDLTFTVAMYDNYDPEAVQAYVGSTPTEQIVRTETHTLFGVHITEDGVVLPDHTNTN